MLSRKRINPEFNRLSNIRISSRNRIKADEETTMNSQFRWVLLLLTMAMVKPAQAGDVEMVLAPPKDPVMGGEVAVVRLYLHNTTDVPITRDLPLTLTCRVDTGRTSVAVEANLVNQKAASRVAIAALGVVQRQYAIALPIYATGAVQLTMEALNTNPLLINVEKAPPEAWVGQQVPLDEGPTMLQSFLDDFSVHQPMYFLLGVDPGLDQSKFQFSFKYRLFNSEGYLAKQAPWITGFHLAYTQRSIWDLKTDSKPFEDTIYMPELLYLLPTIDLNVDRISAFGIQGGYQHESNGLGGADSRSTNYLYIKPIMGVHLAGPYHLKIAPKIYTYVKNEDKNNADLVDFRGYFDFEVGILDPDGLALNTHLWWAKKGASVQMDLTYPISRLLAKSLNFYLQAQYFSGYAETLINFDRRNDAFRLGFAIVR